MSIKNAVSAGLQDVRDAIALAMDGDTVIVPLTPAAGVSWTDTLLITKGITLQGVTTCETSSQYGSVTSANETIIRDDVINSSGVRIPLIKWLPTNSTQVCRLSGFTFRYGTTVVKRSDNSRILLSGSCYSFRMDNCHTDNFYGPHLTIGGDIHGVLDHCFMDARTGTSEMIYVHHDSWLGVGDFGDNSWSDTAHFGTDKFFFIEDNCMNNRGAVHGTMQNGNCDSENGGRVVYRYNHCNNVVGLSGHGTDTSGRYRSMRCAEYYGNTIKIDSQIDAGDRRFTEQRAGSTISFNNVVTTTPVTSMVARACRYYRYFGPANFFSGAGSPCSGTTADWFTSPPFNPERVWDNLVTEVGGVSDDAYVEGHIPHNFDSGTASAPISGDPAQGFLRDSTKSWTPGHWIGYTLVNLNFLNSNGKWPFNQQITGNTDKTITTSNQIFDNPPNITFTAGNHYVIRKLLVGLDQMGYGKGDLIAGNPPVNTVAYGPFAANTVHPVRQAKEGIWAWGNTLNGSPFTLLTTDEPALLVEGTTPGTGIFYNRMPTKTELQGISTDTPDAAFLSGVYIGYTYPHPLTGGTVVTAITSPDNMNFQVGVAGTTYQLTTQGFTGSPTFAVTGGSLPSGLSLSSGGLLSGTPAGGTDAGSPYNVTITATHSPDTPASRLYHVNVAAAVTKVIALAGNMAFGSVTINTTTNSTLNITNSGNTVLTVSSISFPSGYTGNWTNGTIAPGATQAVIVTFSPVAGTTYNGTITVSSDKTSGINTIAVTGLGATRVLSLGGSLVFGNITTGQTATRQLTITNNGNVTMTISSITYPEGFSGDLSSATIAAGASKIVNVTFSPLAAQDYSGNVTVVSNATSGTNTAAASGTGTAAATKIVQLTGSLAFGSVLDGTTLTKVLTITNSGNATLTVTDLTLPTGYTPDWTAGTIAAGAHQDVNITFAPVAAIAYNGTATVVSDATGGTGTAAVTGAGVAPSTKIIALTGSTAFGNVAINTTSTRILTITNSGSAVLTVTSITYPTGYTGAYAGTINPGASHDVTVTFAPTALQDYSGTITVNSDKTSGTETVATTGVGVAAPVKVIALVGDLNYGTVQKNHSVQKVLTIFNNGTTTLTVTNITLPSGFTANWSSGTIAAGASQQVVITFRPISQITYGGVITVVSDATSGINTITCAGNGSNKKQVPFFLIVSG